MAEFELPGPIKITWLEADPSNLVAPTQAELLSGPFLVEFPKVSRWRRLLRALRLDRRRFDGFDTEGAQDLTGLEFYEGPQDV